VLWELERKRFEEHRGNRKLCHLNPFEFFDHFKRWDPLKPIVFNNIWDPILS